MALSPDPDPPLGQCPVHPDRNAWRVCGRCGRFLCALCTHPTVDGPRCAECLALQPVKAERFGALMMLATLTLIAQPATIVFQLSEGLVALSQLGWVDALGLLPAVMAVVILPQYLLKKARAPKQMVAFYGVLVLLNMIELLRGPEGGTGRTLAAIGIGTGWIAYFALNPKVKRVFVK